MATEHITGYQWGDGNRYIGPYDFPNNTDKDDIHLPPRTTLIEPPAEVPAGKIVVWDGARSRWDIVDVEVVAVALATSIAPVMTPIPTLAAVAAPAEVTP